MRKVVTFLCVISLVAPVVNMLLFTPAYKAMHGSPWFYIHIALWSSALAWLLIEGCKPGAS